MSTTECIDFPDKNTEVKTCTVPKAGVFGDIWCPAKFHCWNWQTLEIIWTRPDEEEEKFSVIIPPVYVKTKIFLMWF